MILGVVAAVLFFSGCGNKNAKQSENQTNTISDLTKKDEIKNQGKEIIETSPMDQDLVTGNVRWKVSSVKNIDDEKSKSLKDSEGYFVQIKGKVKNEGEDTTDGSVIDSIGLKIVDHKNIKYGIALQMTIEHSLLEAYISADQYDRYVNFPKSLSPNQENDFVFTYEIPISARGLKLVVGDIDKWGDVGETKKAMIDLGL